MSPLVHDMLIIFGISWLAIGAILALSFLIITLTGA